MNTDTNTHGAISIDLQTKAETAAAAARYRERLAKRKARKARKANSAAHKAAMARRAESAADATRFHNSHTDDLMSAAIVERM